MIDITHIVPNTICWEISSSVISHVEIQILSCQFIQEKAKILTQRGDDSRAIVDVSITCKLNQLQWYIVAERLPISTPELKRSFQLILVILLKFTWITQVHAARPSNRNISKADHLVSIQVLLGRFVPGIPGTCEICLVSGISLFYVYIQSCTRLAVSNISYPLNDIKTENVYTCIYIQCNTSPKFLFNYNKQTKPKDFENIIHKVPVYRHSGPSLQITFDQIRNWTGTQQRFSRGGQKKNWMDQLAWNFFFQWQR